MNQSKNSDNHLNYILISIREVMLITGLSRATIYRKVRDDNFPKPIKLSGSVRWYKNEVEDFITSLPRVQY